MFITLEGLDGSGKSTLAQGLATRLEALGTSTLLTREPGAGEFGAKVRALLLDGADISDLAEVFLFLADRAEHGAHVIRPALDEGIVVICDRHADSTVVYQGYGRGLDVDQLRALNLIATAGLKPDVTLLLDLDVETSLARQQRADRLGSQSSTFFERVRNGFLTEAQREPLRWVLLDASRSQSEVLEQAWAALSSQPRFPFGSSR